jgi:tRNA nucleotidyltransferase (CCA-adding enzyme)
VGCVLAVQDKEIQKMKQEAGPEGWALIKEKFIQDHAKQVGAHEAKRMWEMSTNLKEMHEKQRREYGYMYGEGKANNNSNIQSKQDYLEVEQMLVASKKRQLEEAMQKKKWSWGFW